jgi:hypothetical protein
VIETPEQNQERTEADGAPCFARRERLRIPAAQPQNVACVFNNLQDRVILGTEFSRLQRTEIIGRFSCWRFGGVNCRSGMFEERRTDFPAQHAHHSRRNTIAAMTVGRSAPANNPIGKMAPSKKRPSSAWPAGFGAFAMTVSPPPTTAP